MTRTSEPVTCSSFTSGSVPVRSKCRPLNPNQEADLNRQLKEWLNAGVIEPTVSPWCSALVPCKKKGTTKLRWSIDYRNLNLCTVKDTFPIPHVQQNLEKLSGANIFSTLDSAGAFHSLTITESSRDYTTFVSPSGTFRFVRMPFGLSNSPSAYCRLIQLALSLLPPGFAIAYLDDILIYSKTVKDHIVHIELVLKLHAQVGMKLNLRKCSIFRDRVDYLGHSVNNSGVSMIGSFVDKIRDCPLPSTGKELVSFLDFCSYYRGFIPEFSKTTAGLNKLRNEKTLKLSAEDINNIDVLKGLFQKCPLHAYPIYDSEHPFILNTDFSATAVGGVISQVQGGSERFIGCFSKSCDAAQSNYPSFKGELLAVILGLHKFEHI